MIRTLSCHCGAIRLETNAALGELTECNCSTCGRQGFLHWQVPPDRARLITTEAVRSPPTSGAPSTRATTSARPAASPSAAPAHDYFSLNARCLDGVDVFELKVERYDGLHDMPGGDMPRAEGITSRRGDSDAAGSDSDRCGRSGTAAGRLGVLARPRISAVSRILPTRRGSSLRRAPAGRAAPARFTAASTSGGAVSGPAGVPRRRGRVFQPELQALGESLAGQFGGDHQGEVDAGGDAAAGDDVAVPGHPRRIGDDVEQLQHVAPGPVAGGAPAL